MFSPFFSERRPNIKGVSPFRFRRTCARVVDEAKMMPRYAYGTADKRNLRSCTSDHTSGTELIGYMLWSTVKFEPLVRAREPSFLGDPRELRSIQWLWVRIHTTARMFILASCRPARLKKFRWRGYLISSLSNRRKRQVEEGHLYTDT